MSTLAELLLTDEKRPGVVTDSVTLIDEEVATKGLIIKATYKIVKAVKKTMIKDSVDALLDDFVGRIEPFYVKHKAEGKGTLEAYLGAHAEEIAEALLGITDQRARKSTNKTIVKAYEKLRPTGKREVALAMPRVGRMLTKYGA